ncbi:adenosylcobinamide amidohydrolase [Haloarchaeobius amylolyticus]|uniref:adenosylcobinamide amidohydrolase n=1 Tax=Haloarchaeobius amylolyticus TaxID=1198296 RepID=UPI002271FE4F|nr:adenosylcobinamide amidohydrolase [Haloarchaeobius amylolyticus]
MLFEPTTRADVCRLARPDTDWLSTGWRGGRSRADAAYSISVPEGWHCDDLASYVTTRLSDAGFDPAGLPDAPVLLTGVDLRHLRGARCGPVEAYVTAGVSNPAALPMDPGGGELPTGELVAGTVNVVVGTTRDLAPGALANLVAIAAEAKAATLLDRVGAPGTTSDAVVAASDPDGEPAEFSGSATPVGAAARACVREAVSASLAARYDEVDPPAGVEDATYGVSTDVRAEVFRP